MTWQILIVVPANPAGHDHMRARGMHDLRDVATALYFVKINSVVSFTITFAVQACATLPPYTKGGPYGSTVYCLDNSSAFFKCSVPAFLNHPSSAIFLCASSHLFTRLITTTN